MLLSPSNAEKWLLPANRDRRDIGTATARRNHRAGKNIGMNLLAFARRIAFDPAGTAIDRIAAESGRSGGDFVVRIVMKVETPYLVSDNDPFLAIGERASTSAGGRLSQYGQSVLNR